MTERDDTDDVTYVIETREGREEHVLSTIKKYYEDLLVSVHRNPNHRDGMLIVTTAYELPSDAFARIAEVDDVVQTRTRSD
jgi:hypothetical protein